MALAGIGVDMLEIARMQHALDERPYFIRRLFTEDERMYCEHTARPAEHYAGRFAAREAVLKALGLGFGNGVGIGDVSVVRDDSGRPRVLLAGRAAEVAREQGVREVALSISHTHDVTDVVRPKPDEKEDAAKALAVSFKEARSVIDELERVQETIMDTVDEA